MADARETAVEEWMIAACIEEEIGVRDEFYAALDKQEAWIARKLDKIDQRIFRGRLSVELHAALSAYMAEANTNPKGKLR